MRRMANELTEFVLVSVALLGIGIYGLAVKRNFIRMLFAIESYLPLRLLSTLQILTWLRLEDSYQIVAVKP
jgi:NADH:ubiquinone oxidoreductase subunit K